MRNIGRISATKTLLQKAASIAASRTFPAWIDASEYGVASSIVMPRVRDNLGLRLVAGRRRERDRNLIHATGAP
jgi:uncharacterized membrane protein YidH (DUF202 family)